MEATKGMEVCFYQPETRVFPQKKTEFRSSSRGFRDQTGSGAEFDEYEGADDFDQPPRRSTSASASRTSNRPQPPPKTAVKPEKPVEKPKEMNLFDFDDDPTPAVAPSSGPVGSSAGDGACHVLPRATLRIDRR